MFAKGYIKGKVWSNGFLKQDVEAVAEGNNQNIRLVVRDKNTVSNMIGPTSEVLRAVFSTKPNPKPLEQRLKELAGISSVRTKKKSSKKRPSKKVAKSKAKKRVTFKSVTGNGNGKGKGKNTVRKSKK
jgi:hypothetical protein